MDEERIDIDMYEGEEDDHDIASAARTAPDFDLNKQVRFSTPEKDGDRSVFDLDGFRTPLNQPVRRALFGTGHSVAEADAVPPPRVGMTFPNEEEIVEYYKRYAKQEGFGVVIAGSSFYHKDRKITKKRSITITCECYGKPRPRKVRGKKGVVGGSEVFIVPSPDGNPKKSKKCECTAKVYAVADRDECSWTIKHVVLEHQNHNPTPSKSKYIKQHRILYPHFQRRLIADRAAGLTIKQSTASAEAEFYGPDGLPCSERDSRNYVNKVRRLKLEDGDANAMQQYFMKMIKDNDKFFYACRHDADGFLKDVLWVDPRSRAAYEEFGDVVCFDTTYCTNEYDLPFANFVGVNHHGQTILLGCALISHEDTETFEWVFRTWLGCMGDKAPLGILTDQSAPMRKALASVMPSTRHRWCIWHILAKLPAKVGMVERYEQLKRDIHDVVYDSMRPEEFEEGWEAIMKEYNMESEDKFVWLKNLYEEREMWVPAYVKHLFWAGMKTTQRVESMHHFFDGYLNRHTRLREFVEQYCFAMEKRVQDENRLDNNNDKYVRALKTHFAFEEYFRDIYTDDKFYELQLECERTAYLHVTQSNEVSEGVTEHIIRDRRWTETANGTSRRIKLKPMKDCHRMYRVTFNAVTEEVSCECKMFESSGILCRHCLKVIDQHGTSSAALEKYVLRRWRKDVFRKHTKVKVAYHNHSKTENARRFDKMQLIFDDVAHQAMEFEDMCGMVVRVLQDLNSKLDECHRARRKKLVGEEFDANKEPSSGSGEGPDLEGRTQCQSESVQTQADSSVTPQTVQSFSYELAPDKTKSAAATNTNTDKAQPHAGIPTPSSTSTSTATPTPTSTPFDGGLGPITEDISHYTLPMNLKDPPIKKKAGRKKTEREKPFLERKGHSKKSKKKGSVVGAVHNGDGREYGDARSEPSVGDKGLDIPNCAGDLNHGSMFGIRQGLQLPGIPPMPEGLSFMQQNQWQTNRYWSSQMMSSVGDGLPMVIPGHDGHEVVMNDSHYSLNPQQRVGSFTQLLNSVPARINPVLSDMPLHGVDDGMKDKETGEDE